MCPFTHIAMPAHIDIVSVYHCSHVVRHRECTTAFRKSEMQHWSHETTQAATMANRKKIERLNTQTNVQQLLALSRCFVYLLNLVKLIGDCVCFCFRYGHARSGLSHIVCSNHQMEKESTPRVTEGHIGAPPPPCGPGPSAEGPGRGSPAPPWSTAAAVGPGAVRRGARAGDRPHRLGPPLPPRGPG